jgi:tRNA nucleotidyltransferase (CCA-adding enzyme)
MTETEYLKAILKSQDLADESPELKALIERRQHVEEILRKAFPKCAPTIRYGGSKAKGTLNKEAYDLDMICYFPHDDKTAGETLEDIYNNVAAALTKEYNIVRKCTSIRLRGLDLVDFHIDVIPGRFVDDKKADCYLHQESGEKERLKTNLDVHIKHIRESGVLDAIRLLKLWKIRRVLRIRQFPFELMIIKLLQGTQKSLPDQLKYVWTELTDRDTPIVIEDPANPSGNDVSALLQDAWAELSASARSTLQTLETGGWESIFGKVPTETDKVARLGAAAAAVSVRTKPWCPNSFE